MRFPSNIPFLSTVNGIRVPMMESSYTSHAAGTGIGHRMGVGVGMGIGMQPASGASVMSFQQNPAVPFHPKAGGINGKGFLPHPALTMAQQLNTAPLHSNAAAWKCSPASPIAHPSPAAQQKAATAPAAGTAPQSPSSPSPGVSLSGSALSAPSSPSTPIGATSSEQVASADSSEKRDMADVSFQTQNDSLQQQSIKNSKGSASIASPIAASSGGGGGGSGGGASARKGRAGTRPNSDALSHTSSSMGGSLSAIPMQSAPDKAPVAPPVYSSSVAAAAAAPPPPPPSLPQQPMLSHPVFPSLLASAIHPKVLSTPGRQQQLQAGASLFAVSSSPSLYHHPPLPAGPMTYQPPSSSPNTAAPAIAPSLPQPHPASHTTTSVQRPIG